jgi:predicted transcriptional regulator
MTDYNKLLEMWREEKKKREEVEGENTIIKGIGQNSPEMKALRKENEELRKEMDELKADNKKLAKEINDRVDRLRKAGLV